MKTIATILLFLFVSCSLSAQEESNIQPICRVYGKVQGIYYDAFLNSCAKVSSEAACKDLAKELAASFGMASDDREEYVEANFEGCKIILNRYEDFITFSLEAVGKAKDKLETLYWELLGVEGIEIQKEK